MTLEAGRPRMCLILQSFSGKVAAATIWWHSCHNVFPGSNRIGGNSMRFRTALSLATLFLVCFTIASWSTAASEVLGPTSMTAPPDNQSQSGKIASIGDAAFTLEVIQGQDR